MLGRSLRLPNDQREAVDEQDDVEAAFLHRLEGDLRRDHELIATRVLEVDERDRQRRRLTYEVDLLGAAQPAHHSLVRGDKPVLDRGQNRSSQRGKDLVDAVGVLGDGRVQPDERLRDVRLDEGAHVLAAELLGRHLLPTHVCPGEPADDGRLDGVGLSETTHAVRPENMTMSRLMMPRHR